MRDDPLRGHGACAARHMDLQRPKARPGNARCAPRPSQNVGRHSLAAPDSAFLDPQRAALGRIARRGSEVRDRAGGSRLDASRLGVSRSRFVPG